jgi:hypothetical protein
MSRLQSVRTPFTYHWPSRFLYCPFSIPLYFHFYSPLRNSRTPVKNANVHSFIHYSFRSNRIHIEHDIFPAGIFFPFLRASEKLRKATVIYFKSDSCLHVLLSIRPRGTARLPLDRCTEISIFGNLINCTENVQISIQPDKNNRHIT